MISAFLLHCVMSASLFDLDDSGPSDDEVPLPAEESEQQFLMTFGARPLIPTEAEEEDMPLLGDGDEDKAATRAKERMENFAHKMALADKAMQLKTFGCVPHYRSKRRGLVSASGGAKRPRFRQAHLSIVEDSEDGDAREGVNLPSTSPAASVAVSSDEDEERLFLQMPVPQAGGADCPLCLIGTIAAAEASAGTETEFGPFMTSVETFYSQNVNKPRQRMLIDICEMYEELLRRPFQGVRRRGPSNDDGGESDDEERVCIAPPLSYAQCEAHFTYCIFDPRTLAMENLQRLMASVKWLDKKLLMVPLNKAGEEQMNLTLLRHQQKLIMDAHKIVEHLVELRMDDRGDFYRHRGSATGNAGRGHPISSKARARAGASMTAASAERH